MFNNQKLPELIVIFNNLEKQKIINQARLLKIPVIEFSCQVTQQSSTYNIPCEIKKNNTIFFFNY